MIFWYTGQPGHGKTLHAIDHAIDFRDQGRLVYVCNVRGFKHADARMLEMSPEQFRDWMNFLPDGAVAVVDEAYEHDMLPKRPPGSKVPEHVQQLAKHRHRGLDFIFVSQSPAKQVDEFVHDLIERHVHVRRRFGLPFAHLRTFDRFERNPEKRTPLILKRVKLPKRPMGLYESTVLDTTERKVPWYYIAAFIAVPALAFWGWHTVSSVEGRLTPKETAAATVAPQKPHAGKDGAGATAAPEGGAQGEALRKADYVAWLTPRIGGQPWTAPAYDNLPVPSQPPRLFCMSSGYDGEESCTCKTEQGTNYKVEDKRCRMIARQGQYEPFLNEDMAERNRLSDVTQQRKIAEAEVERGTRQRAEAAGDEVQPGATIIGGDVLPPTVSKGG